MEEAHAEAARIAKISYTPGPGLIEAPAEGAKPAGPEAPVQEEQPAPAPGEGAPEAAEAPQPEAASGEGELPEAEGE